MTRWTLNRYDLHRAVRAARLTPLAGAARLAAALLAAGGGAHPPASRAERDRGMGRRIQGR